MVHEGGTLVLPPAVGSVHYEAPDARVHTDIVGAAWHVDPDPRVVHYMLASAYGRIYVHITCMLG